MGTQNSDLNIVSQQSPLSASNGIESKFTITNNPTDRNLQTIDNIELLINDRSRKNFVSYEQQPYTIRSNTIRRNSIAAATGLNIITKPKNFYEHNLSNN